MIELFVPGRLCLFGEHSDWAAGYRANHPEIRPGYCLVAGTDQGLLGEAAADPRVIEISSHRDDGSSQGRWLSHLDASALDAAVADGGFFSYAAGVVREIRMQHPVRGLRLSVRSNLPVGRGLSSSAAICVLVARAFNHVYDLGLTVHDEMELAYRGERRTGSVCGRMDQICAFGRRPVFLTFDGDGLAIELLEPASAIHLLVVDLARSKDTRRILSDLNACFPGKPGAAAADVRRALGPLNEDLLGRARQAVEDANASVLGSLMGEAQEVFDRLVAPVCSELTAPRLHEVLRHPGLEELSWGGKGVGSQGDGCAQIVVRDAHSGGVLARLLEQDLGVRVHPLTLGPAGAQRSPES